MVLRPSDRTETKGHNSDKMKNIKIMNNDRKQTFHNMMKKQSSLCYCLSCLYRDHITAKYHHDNMYWYLWRRVSLFDLCPCRHDRSYNIWMLTSTTGGDGWSNWWREYKHHCFINQTCNYQDANFLNLAKINCFVPNSLRWLKSNNTPREFCPREQFTPFVYIHIELFECYDNL